MLSLREYAQRALLNAFQLGKPENNAMMTPEHDWYGNAYLLDLANMYDKCEMYSLMIHNIRLCYHGDFPRARQIDDKLGCVAP